MSGWCRRAPKHERCASQGQLVEGVADESNNANTWHRHTVPQLCCQGRVTILRIAMNAAMFLCSSVEGSQWCTPAL